MKSSTSVTLAANSIQAASRRTERFCLVLLCSQPDTVHRFLSRKTQISTSLFEGSPTRNDPRPINTPAIADCRYRAPLTPRLRGNFITILVYIICIHQSRTCIFRKYYPFSFCIFLRFLKNSVSILEHSDSRTPLVTFT